MAPDVLQLIHGGSVVKKFFKKLWRILTAEPAPPSKWTDDEYQGSDIHLDNW